MARRDAHSQAGMDCVGVAGVGLMGSAITRRLVAAGLRVVAYDVDDAKRTSSAKLGATPAESLAATFDRCSTIVLCVFNTEQVEQVVDAAIMDHHSLTVICTSTCDPDRLARLARRADAAGVRFLELPLSGTSQQIAAGDGVGLVGGEETLAEQCAPIVNAICTRWFYLGQVGNASRAKLAVNLILGLNRAALAEGLIIAESLGLEPDAFLEVARGSAAYSAVMETKGPLMAKRTFSSPMSRVDQSLKDFELMLAQAAARGQQLPFATQYAAMLADCVRHGEAEWDNAAIVEAIARQRTTARTALGET